MASAQVELNDQLQNGTAVFMNNHTMADMQLIRSHSWSGHFHGIIDSPPTTIPIHGTVAFDHLKGSHYGSKAAVSYTATNQIGFPLAVILGWNAPANFNSTSPNKVIGVVGPRSLIDAMTWEQIQMLFNRAGSSVDIKDGISMHASIRNNPTTKMADLLANFGSCL